MTSLNLALLFMVVAALVSLLAQRLRLPYTIALVIAGLLAGGLHLFPPVHITSEVLLTLVIPPLLFEGSLHLVPAHLRTYGLLIGLLAVVGTIVAALGIGAAVGAVAHLPMRTALLLGAIAAAIDPVSVIAMIRETRLDPRLAAILEGEAVLNDGVAIVLFSILAGPGEISLLNSAGQFVWLLGVGALVGIALAMGVAYVLGRVTQPLAEALWSLILLVSSLIAAERLHASGVIAVMCAGVVFAGYGKHSLTGLGQETVRTLWDFVAFLANSVLFLFIGLQVPGGLLLRHAGVIAVGIVAALATRALTVYGFSAISGHADHAISVAWCRVLTWGGLRGGVAIALTLGLAPELPGHEVVAAAIFGLVVFTLLAQGLTMLALMRRLGLSSVA
jgi:CPA1 family monovalent cation:H+ antiporter